MREILFRAYDPVLKMMLLPHELEENTLGIKGFLSYGKLTVGYFGDHDYYELIPMQFTGCLDINGEKIFEGDIVSYVHSWHGFLPLKSQVVYCDETASFILEIKKDGDYYYFNDSALSNIEIIGNIHEHSRLLNE